jgi:hypothetical protein
MDPILAKNLANFLYAILIGTIISIFCTMSISGKSAIESLIAEYSVIEGVILLLTVLMTINIRAGNVSLFTFSSFITLFPFVLLLFIIGLFIALLSIYFNRIADNKVSPYYTSFSTTLVGLLIAQLMLLVGSVAKDPTNPVINKKTFSLLMLLGTINLIVVITLGVILKFYSTDC